MLTFPTKGMCLVQNCDWDKMTPSGANSLSSFFTRVRGKLPTVHGKHVSEDELVASLNPHQSALEGGGIVRNAARHTKKTGRDGGRRLPGRAARAPAQPKNNNLKRFLANLPTSPPPLSRLWRPSPKDFGIPVRDERWLDCFTQFFRGASPGAFNMQMVGMQSSDAFI